MPALLFTPRNRLADVLAGPEGDLADALVAEAERRVEGLGPEIRADIDRRCALIDEIVAGGEAEAFGRSLELSDAALAICETAAAAGLEPLGDVARGVRAMIDSLIASGVWHSDALELHVQALTLLRMTPPLPLPQRQAMLTRLRDMRRAVGVVE